jgi:putative nucleotidyltransferase with HDIG domain
VNTPDYEDIIKLVGILTHMREPFDHHGSRVAELAVRMATVAGMSSHEIKLVGVGAHLHDIGKQLIRVELLNSTRKLTDAEIAEMQNHTKLGWHIVTLAGYDKIIQDIVHHHHEKFDGSGYPFGLQKKQIPLVAQVVSICDVYEALTNRRPYREPYTLSFTKALMQRLKGTDFDPELVDLFFEKVVTE